MKEVRTIQPNPSPGFINFGIGQPSSDLLPLAIMREAAAVRLSDGDPSLLHYGYELGDGYFRLALARFLAQQYNMPVDDETLMVTTGVSGALDLICTVFTQPGDVVFVEEPTYFLAPRIFADHGLRIVGLPVDEQGLVVETLAAALAKERPAFVYTIPTFQNPSGVTMPAARRRRLVALSEEYEFLLVADEVYHLLAFQAAPPPPLAATIGNGRILSCGSFSKILAPGLRLGWIQAAPALLGRLAGSGLVDSGGGLNPFTSNLVRVVLEEGWQVAHLAFLQEIYRRRAAAMDRALAHHLAGSAAFVPPQGGFFFWLVLAEAVDAARLRAFAQGYQVGFQPGAAFSPNGGLQNCLRLSFAYYGEEDIEKGIARLAEAVGDYGETAL